MTRLRRLAPLCNFISKPAVPAAAQLGPQSCCPLPAAVCRIQFRAQSTDSGRQRTIVALFGPPGAGKGVVSPQISEAFNIPQVSIGDMLRRAATSEGTIGQEAQEIMRRGGLLPDPLVVGVLSGRIQQEDCERGFLLDGFPRTLGQAALLDKLLEATGDKVTTVLSLEVPDSSLQERICGRWVHDPSGRVYHVTRSPPKSLKAGDVPSPETMLDDVTLEPLGQRPDDTEAALTTRLQTYHKETAPVLAHYRGAGVVRTADADCFPQEMWDRVRPALGL